MAFFSDTLFNLGKRVLNTYNNFFYKYVVIIFEVSPFKFFLENPLIVCVEKFDFIFIYDGLLFGRLRKINFSWFWHLC